MSGMLHLVSVGPGYADLITPKARQAIADSQVVVAYGLYLRWIAPWLEGKEVIDLPLTQERERASLAIQHARSGQTVSLVSSGDIGVYALATLAFDEMREDDSFDVSVCPGVTAATACASLLGAPLSHDFATLSLSDLLCPWEWIERRAKALAQADMACVLYNVQSQTRQEGVYRILDILLEGKSPETLCGVVRNAYRPEQSVRVCSLAELREQRFDMLTSLVIGNRHTRRKRQWIYTPRGYLGWQTQDAATNSTALSSQESPFAHQQESPPLAKGGRGDFSAIDEAANAANPPQSPFAKGGSAEPNAPQNAVWVYAGTADGNALARQIAAAGCPTALSAATAYGAQVARNACPGLHVEQGFGDPAVRARLMAGWNAKAIVDATHPHAAVIKPKLMALAAELGIPYLRYERAESADLGGTIPCDSMADAAAKAVKLGQRIFLATGSKDLSVFLQAAGADQRQWYARITPDPEWVQRAQEQGIPRQNLCAMQGPISRELNEALWRAWGIDCVISKDSGDVGGFNDKAAAARALGIPLLVVRRPPFQYPYVTDSPEALLQELARQGG